MINFDDATGESKTEHNLEWLYIPDHPHRILIIGGSGSGKTLHWLIYQLSTRYWKNLFIYAKDPYETKYQLLIEKREKVGLKHCNDPKPFTEYSNDMWGVYKNIDK